MAFDMNHKMRIAVGVSGSGRSLANLLDRQASLPFEVVLVFSSAENIGANKIAHDANIPLLVENFSLKNHMNAKKSLYSSLAELRVDLVVLAGFLKLLPIDDAWQKKIINIHPALLPKYGGKGMHGHHVHEAVIAARDIESGATVHFVNENYDDGAMIAQSHVGVLTSDTPDTLAARVFSSECELLPWTIAKLATGELPKISAVSFTPTTTGS